MTSEKLPARGADWLVWLGVGEDELSPVAAMSKPPVHLPQGKIENCRKTDPHQIGKH